MFTTRVLGITEAMSALQAMLNEGYKERERPLSFAIVDGHGDLVCYARMDKAARIPQKMALRKAYTAAITGMPSKLWGDNMKSHGMHHADFGDSMLISVQGGLPIVTKDGFCIGGIGVSGRRAEEDEEVAKVGLGALGV